MLTIIVTKLLLNGAIKTFIVRPIMNATMTIFPQSSTVQATLLNSDLLISTGDLIKFGAEALYDRFVGRKLDFQIEKLSKYVFGISPADEFAALFSKQYSDDEELIIDLTKFEDYLDSLENKSVMGISGSKSTDFEVDQVLSKIMQDLDLAINLSDENTFDNIEDEQLLVEQILEKNRGLIQNQDPNILSDFPSVPVATKVAKEKLTDEEEIKKILAKF
ncbi:MAG: hypothetical protein GPJ54_16280 [Candidatus Heimdallarchaeota archaeon]|nr:hypothetical protein [Candidatus Heimdallarchaeota archaeon]